MAKRSLEQMAVISARVPRGYDGYWSIMLALDERGPFSISDVDGRTNVDRADIAQYVRRLVKAGIVRVVDQVRSGAKLYRLVKRPRRTPRPRRDGSLVGVTGLQRMWTAMRGGLRVFSVEELAYFAEVKPAAAANYVRRLANAGYLTPIGGDRWRLKPAPPGKPGDTGPLAPVIMRVNFMWDRNLREAVSDAHVAEEAA
jgi:DNA-binding IscR family transcriptional regulator